MDFIKPMSYEDKRKSYGRCRKRKYKLCPTLYCSYDYKKELLWVNGNILTVKLSDLARTVHEIHTKAKLGSKDPRYYFHFIIWVRNLEAFLINCQSILPEQPEVEFRYKKPAIATFEHCQLRNLGNIFNLAMLEYFTNTVGKDLEDVVRIGLAGKKFMEVDMPHGFLRTSKAEHLKEQLIDNYINLTLSNKPPSKIVEGARNSLWGNYYNDDNSNARLNYRFFCNYTEDGQEVPLRGIKSFGYQYYNLLKYSNLAGLLLTKDEELGTPINDIYDCDISGCHAFSMLVCPTFMGMLYEVYGGFKEMLAECETFEGVFNNPYCYYMCVTYTNLKPKYKFFPMHCDPTKRSVDIENAVVMHHHLVSADKATLWITGYDYLLYKNYYTYDDMEINTFLKAKSGHIPLAYKELICQNLENKYRLRRELKSNTSLRADAYLAKLDTEMCYGISVQQNYTPRDQARYEWQHLHTRLLSPMWGIQCVSFSNARLGLTALKMLKHNPDSVHYGDTDSLKVDYTAYNVNILTQDNVWAANQLEEVLPAKYENLVNEVGLWMNETWKESHHFSNHVKTLTVYKPKQYAAQYEINKGLKTDITWAGVPKELIKEVLQDIPDVMSSINSIADHPKVIEYFNRSLPINNI